MRKAIIEYHSSSLSNAATSWRTEEILSLFFFYLKDCPNYLLIIQYFILLTNNNVTHMFKKNLFII